ncbi:MAG: DUF421 domain-containing protein [Clostridiales bacterium]|nr:DUF421 domain-containing protein [Clostridiales bacterium]
MTIVLIRTIILYSIVLFVIRIMGKAELSKMSPFQLIVIFMIAELASIPIESPDVSMITGISAIFTLLFLQVFISFLSIKSEKLKNFFNGKPSVLIDKGAINEKELKKLRITINDLVEQLRISNSPSIVDVEYAVMESNGELSVIPKADKKPLTCQDMSLEKNREIMPVVFISDGALYESNLVKAGWTKKQLFSTLTSMGILDYKKVFLAFCDEQVKLHVYMPDNSSSTVKEIRP